MYLRKKRNKRKKVHQVSPLHNKALLAHPDYALGIEVAPFLQVRQTQIYPRKPIITIPTSIQGYGDGDDAQEGLPEHYQVIEPALTTSPPHNFCRRSIQPMYEAFETAEVQLGYDEACPRLVVAALRYGSEG